VTEIWQHPYVCKNKTYALSLQNTEKCVFFSLSAWPWPLAPTRSKSRLLHLVVAGSQRRLDRISSQAPALTLFDLHARTYCDFFSDQASNQDDPTQSVPASIANLVGNFVNASPLAEGKKKFVSMLAGNYDEAATKAKLESLIQNEPVLMLSFTK